MRVRAAHLSDVSAMAHVMVDTFLSAHRDHIPEEVWKWRQQFWTYGVSARGWERTLQNIAEGNNPAECVYVAEQEPGEIVGVAGGHPAASVPIDRTGEIYALYVHLDYQRRGVGHQLIGAVADHFAQQGIAALQIGTLKTNAPARRFYEALGGRVVGERDIEEAGFQLREVIYGWSDLTTLAANP